MKLLAFVRKHLRIFIFSLIFITVSTTGVVTLNVYRQSNDKASVYIPKQKTSVAPNQELEIPIFIDTKGDTINAAEVYIDFNPVDMEVVDVTRDGSFFKIWLTNMPKFSNEVGEIHFAGGLPKPGYKGIGQVGTVKMKLLRKQDAELVFNEKTRILKNDGNGTFVPLRLEPVMIRAK